MLECAFLRPVAKANSLEPVRVLGIASARVRNIVTFVHLVRQVRLVCCIDFVGARFLELANFDIGRLHELVHAFVEVEMGWVDGEPSAVEDLSDWDIISPVRRAFASGQMRL